MTFSDIEESGTTEYGRSYVIALIALTVVALGIQVVACFSIPVDAIEESPSARLSLPAFRGSSRFSSLRPGTGVLWRGTIWISASPPTAIGVRPGSAAAPSSQLLTIDPDTGAVRDTGIALAPAPTGMVVVDDELYAVTNSVVYLIDGSQAVARSPRRGLVRSSAPFVYEGRLAVLDYRNDVDCALLTWRNGEWEPAGQVQIPSTDAQPSLLDPAELRVVTGDEKSYLFLADPTSIRYREGWVMDAAPDAASALRPANPRRFNDESQAQNSARQTRSSREPPGWQTMPVEFSLFTPFQTVMVGDKLWTATVPAQASGYLLHRFENGRWVQKFVKSNIMVTPYCVITGSSNYLVTDDLTLYTFDDPTNPQLIGSVKTVVRPSHHVAFWFTWYLRHALASTVLGIGTWWLMRRHRSSPYVYGHRHAVRASLLRRGIARGIDSVVLLYPSYVWFTYASAVDSRALGPASERDAANVILFLSIGVFGIWFIALMLVSLLEGFWGVTPGKWVSGTRTMRTTLRPCGLVRALARELLIYVDSLMFLAWFPGILLIGLTKRWQRVGDLTADTVVVLKPKQANWEN